MAERCAIRTLIAEQENAPDKESLPDSLQVILDVLSEKLRHSTSTLLSFVALGTAIAYGLLTVVTYERSASDWSLFSSFGGLFVSLLVGSVVVVLFSVNAFIRRERRAAVSLLISLPCLCFALWSGFSFVSIGKEQERKRAAKELAQSHRGRLISVSGLLGDEEWTNDDSPRGRALRGVLWSSEGSFSDEDFLILANRNSSWLETMFYHKNCPLILLSKGFNSYKLRPDRLPLSASFRQILKNPNSPRKFVEEVSTWSDLSKLDRWLVNRILMAKFQKQLTEQVADD